MEGFVRCQSCGMPIQSDVYCQYCVDENGKLQTFDARFASMVQWAMMQDPNAGRAEVEQRTRAYMRTMPAWKDHPALAE